MGTSVLPAPARVPHGEQTETLDMWGVHAAFPSCRKQTGRRGLVPASATHFLFFVAPGEPHWGAQLRAAPGCTGGCDQMFVWVARGTGPARVFLLGLFAFAEKIGRKVPFWLGDK